MKKSVNAIVIVAALGYFVDIYDLILFAIVRESSLTDLGLTGDQLTQVGGSLMSWQMWGMLLGGLLFGVLGDRKGRIQVLFGSIILYSVANIVNGFVTDILTYKIIRFIAGVGLSGELGAGITLVVESLDKTKRGIGTLIVVSFGALGAILAAYIGINFNWRVCYYVGGGLGLLLLFLRIGAYESGMFKALENTKDVARGNLLMLVNKWSRLKKYILSILIGLPVWYTVGIPILFAKEFSVLMDVDGEVNGIYAVMFAYLGLSAGDLVSGLLSQLWRSRKKVVILFILMNLALVLVYLYYRGLSLNMYYGLCFLLGTGTGFWGLFVTMASEQFGTNMRSTVTTTVPNFVRGAFVPILWGFKQFNELYGLIDAALIMGIICTVLALVSTLLVKETFEQDLDYIETL